MTQNIEFVITPELNPKEMDGIRDFVTECRTGSVWEFDNEAVENAERHIRKWVENRAEE